MQIPSFFAFSFPKAGSTLLDGLMLDVCRETGIRYFAPTIELFSLGQRAVRGALNFEELYRSTGYCYSGFREFPSFLDSERLHDRKAILLVRDPRDILTSLYFSTALSHAPPGAGALSREFMLQRQEALETSIDDFVRRRLLTIETILDAYVKKLRCMNLRLYRYEDVIYRKLDWLRDMVAFIGINTTPSILEMITARHDLRPAQECPDQHVRQVQPGDHRRKLRQETVDYLNTMISSRWRLFGYPFQRAGSEIFLAADVLRKMPEPHAGIKVRFQSVGRERVAQLQSAFLPLSQDCRVDPSRGAQIVGLWLEQPDGSPCAAVKAKARFTVAYIVHFQDTVGDVSFGVRIADANKNGVATSSLRMMQLPLPNWPRDSLTEVRWEMDAPSAPGEYFFGCGCALANEPGVYAARHLDGHVGRIVD